VPCYETIRLCQENRPRSFRPRQCRLRRETGTAWSAQEGLPLATECGEGHGVGRTPRSLRHLYGCSRIHFVWIRMGDRRMEFGAVSKIPSLLKSQLNRTPRIRGLSVACQGDVNEVAALALLILAQSPLRPAPPRGETRLHWSRNQEKTKDCDTQHRNPLFFDRTNHVFHDRFSNEVVQSSLSKWLQTCYLFQSGADRSFRIARTSRNGVKIGENRPRSDDVKNSSLEGAKCGFELSDMNSWISSRQLTSRTN